MQRVWGGGRACRVEEASTLDPAPYTLHPTPYILHPTPYTLHPTPYTLHPTPYTPHPTPYTLHPAPYTIGTSRVEEANLDQTRHAALQHHPPLHRKPLIPHLCLHLVFRCLPTCPRLRFRVKGFGMLWFGGLEGWGLGVWGLGCRVAFRVSGIGFRVSSFGCRVSGFEFRVLDSRSRVWGSGFGLGSQVSGFRVRVGHKAQRAGLVLRG